MDERLLQMLSLYFDGELPEDDIVEVERLIESSHEAKVYLDSLGLLRKNLRYEAADSPDVTDRVLTAVATDRPGFRFRNVRWAAAFAAGAVAGAVFIGVTISQPAPVAAADIPSRMLETQSEVSSLTADVHITERGWHPEVTERVFNGRIVYQSPESLWVEMEDLTAYPSEAWISNDTTLVVDEDVSWTSGPAACPTEALPSCTPASPRIRAESNREPFPEASPAPLDLVVPVTSFRLDSEPDLIGYRAIDGRQAVGVRVTAAQVAAVINGLTSVGNWREVHPTDVADLWLDADYLVPLAMTIVPNDSPDRRLWAIRNGYTDSPDLPILEVAWSNVSVNGPTAMGSPTKPADAQEANSGFEDLTGQPDGLLATIHLPDGMTLHRSGVVNTGGGPAVWVSSWTDGRAWLKISWTTEWTGSRLFGGLGTLVRVASIDAGIVYLDERGERVAIHSRGVDFVITGSLSTDTLVEIAASLDIRGEAVPEDWSEAATATIQEAAGELENLLVPVGLDHFAAPAIRVESDLVVLSYAGPGNRAFLLTEAVDRDLSPPLEADVRGVTVRGLDGRYSPRRGQLEWVEGNLTVSLTSSALSMDELVAIAETMESP